MKKIFRFVMLAAALFTATSLSAQEDPQKQTVIIEPFTKSPLVTYTATDNVRSAVITGFSEINRFYIVDALTDSRLKGLFDEGSYEDVVTESNWQTESTAAYKAVNANFLLKGQVEMLEHEYKVSDSGDSLYYTLVNFTVQLFDITNGTLVGSKNYKLKELSMSSYDDAFNSCLKKIAGGRNDLGIKVKSEMLGFCDEYFKVNTYILELGEADKKGNITELWISGGEEMGFSKGSIFAVYKEKKIGPKVTREKIAEVVAEEVLDGLSRCKVSKKDAPIIQQEFNAGVKLIIELDRQRGSELMNFGKALLG